MTPHAVSTPRLLLRPLSREDLVPLHAAVLGDPEVTWDGRARTLEEAREALQRKLRHVEAHGFGMLAVIERATGELLGYAGLQHLEDGPEVEVGYYLGRAAWGRGLGTEVACALVDHGLGALGLERIVAVVRPENAASQRVLAKAGLRFEREARHYGAEVQLWARERDSL